MEAAPTFVALALLGATGAIPKLAVDVAALWTVMQAKRADKPAATRIGRRVDEG